jgi:hypothetical protein
MSTPNGIDTAIQREILLVALRNGARSTALLMVAVLFISWLGWQGGNRVAAATTLVLGTVVSAWRLWMRRRHDGAGPLDAQRMPAVVRELELNAVLVGVMWVISTVFIYPTLRG